MHSASQIGMRMALVDRFSDHCENGELLTCDNVDAAPPGATKTVDERRFRAFCMFLVH